MNNSLLARCVQAFIASAEARGISREAIREALGLGPDASLAGNGPMDGIEFARVSRAIKTLMRDEFGGLTASPGRPGTFALMAEFALIGTTLGEALGRAFRFFGVVVEGVHFRLVTSGEEAVIEIDLDEPQIGEGDMRREWWLLYWHRFAGWLIGEELPATVAEISTRAESQLKEYIDALGCEWRFNQARTHLVFPQQFLRKTVVRQVDEIKDYGPLREMEEVSGQTPTAKSFKSILRQKLHVHLDRHQHVLTLDELAWEYGVSAQTLRRRLESCGTSYARLKDEVRREIALSCLAESELSVAEISFRAGFADATGLSRAVKAWTGMSATEYREGQRPRIAG